MPYTRLPKKRERPRMGVKDEVRRVFEVHRAGVRRHRCAIPNCPYQDDPTEFAHIGPVGSGGMGLKSPDWDGTGWCRTHHQRAHQVGHETMCRESGTTMEAQREIAHQYARTSTDRALREAFREYEKSRITLQGS